LVDEKAETKTEQGAKEKLRGSFETFGIRESDSNPNGSTRFKQVVTLVWTDKETPMNAPTIDSVMRQITRPDKKTGKPELPTSNGEPYVLHHGSSEDLERYVRLAPSNKWYQKNIWFMRATIPPPPGSKSYPGAERGITTDNVLVDALKEELCLRIPALNRPSPGDPLPRIVVIAESDSRYSQAILGDLHKKLKDKAQFQFYPYLRGLDGRSETAATTLEVIKPESRDPVDLILQRRGIAEKSSGTSQFDYLRRLALRLGSQTKKEKELDVAVGVLGSDIYDKMLVLQAVRGARPSAIFFTTDLDSLYLEQESEQFTRNLVVASADSLDVSDMPPMRDSYQTVVAKKVLDLLSAPTPTPTPTSQVFEIALGKSIALNAPDVLEGAGNWVLQLPSMRCANMVIAQVFEMATGKRIVLNAPDVLKGVGNWVMQLLSKGYMNIFIFGLALTNAFLVLGSVFTRTRPNAKRPETAKAPMKPGARAFVYVEVGLAFIMALVLAILCIFCRAETLLLGEPLALGISIWPSVMIRLLAFVVAICLLLLASRSLVAGGAKLKEKLETALNQMQLPEPPDLATENPHFHSSLATECQRIGEESRRLWENVTRERAKPSSEKPFDRELTRFFGRDDSPRGTDSNPSDHKSSTVWWRDSRLWRLIMWSVVYFAISVLLFWYWPPSVPGRGAVALIIEKIVLALGVTLYIVHLVFCLDLHVGAYKFIRALRSTYEAAGPGIDAKSMLEGTSALTEIIGRTLLYPLTVLILIVLSRLPSFDNWVMTPSLALTFSGGALVLMIASLSLWVAGSRLKKVVLLQRNQVNGNKESDLAEQILKESSRRKAALAADGSVTSGVGAEALAKERETLEKELEALTKELEAVRKMSEKEKADLDAINDGVFAAWYNQPIFAAIFSAAAVFGSLSVVGPLARLFFS